jgi:hypothetical protein
MTRDQQLVFCKKCLNRKMDFQQGLICNLTDEKAIFENKCVDFKLDETEIENPLDGVEKMLPDELKLALSPEIIEKFRMEQRLILGILSGLIVGVLGAILWGVITVATGYQIGYMALAIGAGVGLTIRITGKGIDTIFGIWGAGIALFSVLLGNFLSIIGFLANSEGLGYIETLLLFDYSYLPQVMAETFSLLDLLFYGIAIYEGFRFSFRKITEDKVVELRDGKITNR